MNSYAFAWAIGLLGIMLFSQSCAMKQVRRPASKTEFAGPMLTMTGSAQVYAYGKGQTAFVTKGLEELYPDGVIDFLHSPDPMVRQLFERIPFNAKFYILVLNGTQSKKTLLQINSAYEPINQYAQKSERFATGKQRTWQPYTLSTNVKSASRLTNLKLHIINEGLSQNEFISSALHCVMSNAPGPKGEYRNGALTVQIVDASMTTFDEITRGAGRTARLFAEFTIHKENRQAHCQ